MSESRRTSIEEARRVGDAIEDRLGSVRPRAVPGWDGRRARARESRSADGRDPRRPDHHREDRACPHRGVSRLLRAARADGTRGGARSGQTSLADRSAPGLAPGSGRAVRPCDRGQPRLRAVPDRTRLHRRNSRATSPQRASGSANRSNEPGCSRFPFALCTKRLQIRRHIVEQLWSRAVAAERNPLKRGQRREGLEFGWPKSSRR